MNTHNFKIFVEALEALPDEIKNNQVDMNSVFEPVCGTPGCFGGLTPVPSLINLTSYVSSFICLLRCCCLVGDKKPCFLL
jgi:hypothetical protein